MTQGIDFSQIDYTLSQKYLTEIVHTDDRENILSEALLSLQKLAPFCGDNITPFPSRKVKQSNLSGLPGELVADVIGRLDLSQSELTVTSSFLVGRKPKLYILPYIFFSQGLGASLTIWFDDVIAHLHHKRGWDEQLVLNNEYKKAITPFGAKIVFSSEYFSNKVIPGWLLENASKLSWQSFASVLPYNARRPEQVKVLDVLHLLWQSVVLSQCNQDCFLTAINTKSQFELIRQLCGTKRNFIYLYKLQTELGDPSLYSLGQKGNIFDAMNNEAITHFYKYYSFAHSAEINIPVPEKVQILNQYLNSIYS